MPDLSDKLKSLGVPLGPSSGQVTPHPGRENIALDIILGGHVLQTPYGQAYLIENDYFDYTHGAQKLSIPTQYTNLASWAREPGLPEIDPHAIAFLDTETTGLSGGTGTLAFLIGMGRFVCETFHLVQYFLPDPGEESAQLAAVEQFLAACQALVTFNGKSFDIPLLNTRYTMRLACSLSRLCAHRLTPSFPPIMARPPSQPHAGQPGECKSWAQAGPEPWRPASPPGTAGSSRAGPPRAARSSKRTT